jgi:predicted nucleotidyltransferase
MELLKEIIEKSKLHPSRIFNVYLFGSRVYQTANENSDWDVIIVANNSVESTEIRNGLYNIHIYTPDKFKADLDWHRPNNLECIFAPYFARLKETIDYKKDFKLSIPKLRHATSHVSSNSWVKAKKKLMCDEYLIGVKSLFHSMRIPLFSKQIVDFGEIKDFTSANWIWEKIKSKTWNWEELDNEFRTSKNQILTNFRQKTYK